MADKRRTLITLGRHLQVIATSIDEWADNFPKNRSLEQINEGLKLLREDISRAKRTLQGLSMPELYQPMTVIEAVEDAVAGCQFCIQCAIPEKRGEGLKAVEDGMIEAQSEYCRALNRSGFELIARAELMPQSTEKPDDLLNHEDAGEAATVSAATIRRWLNENKLTGHGANRRVSKSELLARLPTIKQRTTRTSKSSARTLRT